MMEKRMPVKTGPWRWAGTFVVAAYFLFSAAGAGFSFAGEGTAQESDLTPDTGTWAGPVPEEEPLTWADIVPWAGPVPFEEPFPWKRPVPPGYMEAFGKTMDE